MRAAHTSLVTPRHLLARLLALALLVAAALPLLHPIAPPAPPTAPIATQPIAAQSIAAQPAKAPQQPPTFRDDLPGISPAFMRDIDLGGGNHTAMIAAAPLRYRAADGAWLPIDASFAPTPNGFTSARNLLQIQTSCQPR